MKIREKILNSFCPDERMCLGKNYFHCMFLAGHEIKSTTIDAILSKMVSDGELIQLSDAYILPPNGNHHHEGNGNGSPTTIRQTKPETLPRAQGWERQWEWPPKNHF